MTALPRPTGISVTPRADSSITVSRPAVVEKPRKPASRLRRRIIASVIVLLAIVSFWPAQYGGTTGLTVVSSKSMQPTYAAGDLVVSLRLPEYRVGDVISYLVPQGQAGAGTRVLHRITAVDQSTGGPIYTTMGDNNAGATDPWMISPRDVMGAAVFALPGFGTLLGGMSNPLLVGLILAVLLIVVVWSADPRNPNKRKIRAKDVAE